MASNKLEINVVADTSDAQSGIDKLEESLKQLDKAGEGITQTGKALDDLGNSATKAAESMPGPKAAEGVKKVGIETKLATKATEELRGVWGRFADQMKAVGTSLATSLSTAFATAMHQMVALGRSAGSAIAAGIEAGLRVAGLAASIGAIIISAVGLGFKGLYEFAQDQGRQFSEVFADAFAAGLSPEKFVEARSVFRAFGVEVKNAEELAQGLGESLKKAVNVKGGKKVRAMFQAIGVDIKKLEKGGRDALPELKKIFDILADPKISTQAKSGMLDTLLPKASREAKAQLAEMARSGGKSLDELVEKYNRLNTQSQIVIQQQEALSRATNRVDVAWEEATRALKEFIHYNDLWEVGVNLTIRALDLLVSGLQGLASFLRSAKANLDAFLDSEAFNSFAAAVRDGMASAQRGMGVFVTGLQSAMGSLASWLADTGSKMWTAFMEGFKPATDVLAPLLAGLIDTISGWAGALANAFLSVTQPAFLAAMTAAFEAVKSVMTSGFSAVGDIIQAGGVGLARRFGQALSGMIIATKDQFDQIKGFVSSAVDQLVAVIAELGPKLAAATTNAFNQMYQAVVDALKKIKDYIESWIPSLPTLSLPQILGGTGKAAPQRQWLPFAVPDAATLRAANAAAMGGGFAVPRVGALAATTGSAQAAAASRAATQSASQEAAIMRVLTGEYEKNTRAVRENSSAKRENQSVQELLTQSQKLSNQELASYAQSLLDALDPMRVYNREMEKYNQLLALGVVGENARAEAMRRAKEAMEQVTTGTQKQSTMMEDLKSGLTSWGDQVAASLARGIVEGEDLSDVLKNLAKDLAAMLLELLVFRPLMNSLTGAIGGIFPKGLAVPQAANQNAMLRAGSTQQQAAMGIVRGASTSASTSTGGTGKGRGGIGVQNNLGDIQMSFGVEPAGVRASTAQAKQFGENVRTLVQMEMVRQSRPGGLLRQGR